MSASTLRFDSKAGPRAAKEGRCGLITCRASDQKMRRCGGCKSVRYCSKECQRADWKYHRAVCVTSRLLPLIGGSVDNYFARHTLQDTRGYWEIVVPDVGALGLLGAKLREPGAGAHLMAFFAGSRWYAIPDPATMRSLRRLNEESPDLVEMFIMRGLGDKLDQSGIKEFLGFGPEVQDMLIEARVGRDIPVVFKITDDGSGRQGGPRIIPAVIPTAFERQ